MDEAEGQEAVEGVKNEEGTEERVKEGDVEEEAGAKEDVEVEAEEAMEEAKRTRKRGKA